MTLNFLIVSKEKITLFFVTIRYYYQTIFLRIKCSYFVISTNGRLEQSEQLIQIT